VGRSQKQSQTIGHQNFARQEHFDLILRGKASAIEATAFASFFDSECIFRLPFFSAAFPADVTSECRSEKNYGQGINLQVGRSLQDPQGSEVAAKGGALSRLA
jgi:hypothetical protein